MQSHSKGRMVAMELIVIAVVALGVICLCVALLLIKLGVRF